MVDIHALGLWQPLADAERGHTADLVAYLEKGGEITPAMREVIVQLLKEVKPKDKRYPQQERAEFEIGFVIRGYMAVKGVNQAEAIRYILEANPNMTRDTVKNYLRNYRKRYIPKV